MRTLPDEGRPSPWYSVTTDAVRVLCGLELPAYLVPPGVTLLSDLPRTPTGKTDGRALTALALADAAAVEAGHGTGSTPWCPDGWLGVVAACWSQELNLPVGQLRGTSDFRASSLASSLSRSARVFGDTSSSARPAESTAESLASSWGLFHLSTFSRRLYSRSTLLDCSRQLPR